MPIPSMTRPTCAHLLATLGLLASATAPSLGLVLNLPDLVISEIEGDQPGYDPQTGPDPDNGIFTTNAPTAASNTGLTYQAVRLTYDWSQTLIDGLSPGFGAYSSDTADLTIFTPVGDVIFGNTSRLPGTSQSDAPLTGLVVEGNLPAPFSGAGDFSIGAFQFDLRDFDFPPAFGSEDVTLSNVSLELLENPVDVPSLADLSAGALTVGSPLTLDTSLETDDLNATDGAVPVGLPGNGTGDVVYTFTAPGPGDYAIVLNSITADLDVDLFLFDDTESFFDDDNGPSLGDAREYVNLPGLLGGEVFYVAVDGYAPAGVNEGEFTLEAQPGLIPEPTSLALLMAGASLAGRRRR